MHELPLFSAANPSPVHDVIHPSTPGVSLSLRIIGCALYNFFLQTDACPHDVVKIGNCPSFGGL